MNKLSLKLNFLVLFISVFVWSNLLFAVELTVKLDNLAADITSDIKKPQKNTVPVNLMVADYDEVGGLAKKKMIGKIIPELLISRLEKAKGISVIERKRLKDIVEELSLSQTGLLDDKKARRVGLFAGADILITGSVSEVGADYLISTRVIDVETAKVLKSYETKVPIKSMIALSSDVVVTRTKTDALIRSAVLPGWGQTYNKQYLKGYTFLALAGSTIVGVLGCYGGVTYYNSEYENTKNASQQDKIDDLDKKRTMFSTVGNYMTIAYAAVWAINMADIIFFSKDWSEVDLSKMKAEFAFNNSSLTAVNSNAIGFPSVLFRF